MVQLPSSSADHEPDDCDDDGDAIKENLLFVFDLASGNPLAYIPAGRQPNHVVLFGTRAYVPNYTDASITVIDTATNRPLKTLTVGGLGLALKPALGSRRRRGIDRCR